MSAVKTPVEGYNGTVAGVTFVDGVGETDDPAALRYFEAAGYEVDAEDKVDPAALAAWVAAEEKWKAEQAKAPAKPAAPAAK